MPSSWRNCFKFNAVNAEHAIILSESDTILAPGYSTLCIWKGGKTVLRSHISSLNKLLECSYTTVSFWTDDQQECTLLIGLGVIEILIEIECLRKDHPSYGSGKASISVGTTTWSVFQAYIHTVSATLSHYKKVIPSIQEEIEPPWRVQ